MPGFGFGFGAHGSFTAARYISVGPGTPVPLIAPSPQWSGIAGSGFLQFPVDPNRTTAKPVMQLVVPPNQFYTDELLVGVMAGANDVGSLRENMGLEKVTVHCEGFSRDISTPTFQSFVDANGAYRTYFGWWAILRNDGRSGHAQVYFEAVPKDRSMQNRVVGPYQFSPQAKLNDAAITVAASGDGAFLTIAEALSHCRAQAFTNPLITITEPGSYDIADAGASYEGQGYCTITASVPGVRIARVNYVDDASATVRPGYNGLRLRGANLTLDMQYISQLSSEPGAQRKHWLDGCTITNSAGQGALWRGLARPAGSIIGDGGWYTECQVSDCTDPFKGASLVRGTSETRGLGHLYSGCAAVIDNRSVAHRSDTTLARDIPAIEIGYVGTATHATIELLGDNAADIRTATVKIAGQADRSFALEKSETAYQSGINYTLQHLVDWLNSIDGVAAVSRDSGSGRAAAWLGLPGTNGGAFSATDIKTAPLTLATFIDIPTAWWQAGTALQNVIVWGNLTTGLVAPNLDLNGNLPKQDFLVGNNAFHNDPIAALSASYDTHFDGHNSHVMFVHNTLSTQQISFRTNKAYTSDSYSLIANNSVRAIAWSGSADSLSIVGNHIHGGQVAPASATGLDNVRGTSIDGNETSLYLDHRNGDFTARGALLTNLVDPVLAYNRKGDLISSPGVKGSEEPGLPIEPNTASSVSQRGITYTFDRDYPVGQYANGDWWVEGPVVITAISPQSTQASGTFADGTSYSERWVHGTMVNPGNRSYAGGSTAANQTNSAQGFDNTLASDGGNATLLAYDNSINIDPGCTGQPLSLSTGSVVKAKSNLSHRPDGRACLTDMVVLTVVSQTPAIDALRPAVSMSDKSSPFRASELDLSVFRRVAPPSSAPGAAAAAALVGKYYENAFPDSINSRNIHASNNMQEYGREIGNDVHTACLSLHFDYSAQEKLSILLGLVSIGIDAWGRALEGAIVLPAGGGNAWKKTSLTMTAAALHQASDGLALTSLQTCCDGTAQEVFAEDLHFLSVSPQHVTTSRYSSPGRRADPFFWWHLGAIEFTPDARSLRYEGTNWDVQYRTTLCNSLLPGILAVDMTTGGRALWNSEDVFVYLLGTQWYNDVYRDLVGAMGIGGTNGPTPLTKDMLALHRPANLTSPLPIDGGVKDNIVWFRSPVSLDETRVPLVGNFTVKVNGAAVRVTAIEGIYRENVGLRIESGVDGNAVVLVSYTPGAENNRVRSVDHIELPAFTDYSVNNLGDKVGGPNLAFPIVRFDKANQDKYQIVGSRNLGADSAQGTLFIAGLKLLSAPSANWTLLGQQGGNPIFEIELRANRRVGMEIRRADGSRIGRVESAPLTVGRAYNLFVNWDFTDAAHASGHTIQLMDLSKPSPAWANGKQNVILWTSGIVGWSTAENYTVGGMDGQYLDIELGGLWLNTTQRLGNTERDKLTSITDGDLDIKTLGDGPTGTRPQIFIVGSAEQFNDPLGINRGSGPKFYVNQGGVNHVSGANWR